MTCHVIRGPNGAIGFACTRTPRRKIAPCAFCSRSHSRLCDGPGPRGGTCDKRLCLDHATHVGVNRDLCPDCRRAQQLALPGVTP